MNPSLETRLKETLAVIRSKSDTKPDMAIVLGSGLGPLAGLIEGPVRIPYAEIPHFKVSTVSGHAGELIIGTLRGKNIICMNGRVHYYEGYSLDDVTYPTRLFGYMGVKTLFLTNAVGGINTTYSAGDLMIITDHINLMGSNPLIGPNHDKLGPRFPDMSNVYSGRLQTLAEKTAHEMAISLQKGVYAAMTGPSYETPAEIRMLRAIGADAVGMSTVPEAIVANHMGMEILAISCVTNAAAGMEDKPLSHTEVTETANRIQDRFTRLASGIIAEL